MASRTHATNERPVPASSSVPVESFAGNGNGDLSITLNRAQWSAILGSLGIAAGQCAVQRDYEQVVGYAGLCNFIAGRLGITAQTAAVGDLPPPMTTRAASA